MFLVTIFSLVNKKLYDLLYVLQLKKLCDFRSVSLKLWLQRKNFDLGWGYHRNVSLSLIEIASPYYSSKLNLL